MTETKPKEIVCPECNAHYLEGYKHRCPQWMVMLKKRFKPNEKGKQEQPQRYLSGH